MASTNFDLAPPVVTVDGLTAVPIDIQHVTATLTFDGATSTATGDATIDFVMGPQNGNPIFDLRQTISAVWLDSVSVPPAQAAHHDFGGGPNAELRILQSTLAAGSAHSLRVTYPLGLPQASSAGSYQPGLTWSAGPRLAFNFGFTDLGAGRYLEAWVPANLIYDQFPVDLELVVLNTAIPHTVITNGTVTTLGSSQWQVAFPARFTALSTLLELRATDTLQSLTDTTTLPVSGKTVTIEAWKLAAGSADLATEIADLKAWLAANETTYGPYLHGNRFVAFLNVGGMEYEGGTTSAAGSLRHETLHSWYGRGVKPAGQADGWWDEAWDVYNDLGATGSLPFDFTDPQVELNTRNPWTRITPGASYTTGERFFEGVAGFIGVGTLKSHMSAFYRERNPRPATTAELEAFLVSRSGEPRIVDAFHRFVYGFPDPSPAPDLWLKDDPGDPGGNLWAGRFWDSPDLWIRNADDGGTTHQPVEHGQDNWFYARVRNRSATATARHFLVTFNVKPFAGVEFLYPQDFLPAIAAVGSFELGPGASTIVKARWPAALVPPVGTHACWLAAVLTRSDEPGAGLHVWEHNNLAQKNLAIVDLVPDARFIVPFVLGRIRDPRPPLLEFVRPPGHERLEASLLHASGAAFGVARLQTPAPAAPADADGRLDCGGVADPGRHDAGTLVARRFEGAAKAVFEPGKTSALQLARAPGPLRVGLQLHVPATAKPGEVLTMDLVKRDGTRVVGGIAVHVRVVKP